MKQRDRTNLTKRLISLALYELLLKHDFDNVTISDICRKAGVSRMSFYRYYTTKDDIFIDFSDERFAEFFNDVVRYRTPSLEEFLLGMFYYFKNYRRQLVLLIKSKKESILLRQLNSYVSYLIKGGKLSNISFDLINEYVIPFFAGGVYNSLLSWAEKDYLESPEEVSAKVLEILKGHVFAQGHDPHKLR